MGLTEALSAYNRFMAMCPACRKAALDAGKRRERLCHEGKHVKTRVRGLSDGPPRIS